MTTLTDQDLFGRNLSPKFRPPSTHGMGGLFIGHLVTWGPRHWPRREGHKPLDAEVELLKQTRASLLIGDARVTGSLEARGSGTGARVTVLRRDPRLRCWLGDSRLEFEWHEGQALLK